MASGRHRRATNDVFGTFALFQALCPIIGVSGVLVSCSCVLMERQHGCRRSVCGSRTRQCRAAPSATQLITAKIKVNLNDAALSSALCSAQTRASQLIASFAEAGLHLWRWGEMRRCFACFLFLLVSNDILLVFIYQKNSFVIKQFTIVFTIKKAERCRKSCCSCGLMVFYYFVFNGLW